MELCVLTLVPQRSINTSDSKIQAWGKQYFGKKEKEMRTLGVRNRESVRNRKGAAGRDERGGQVFEKPPGAYGSYPGGGI